MMVPKRLNIGWKLNLGIGLLVVLSLAAGTLSFIGGRRSSERINLTAGIRAPTALASMRAQTNLLRMQANVRGYLALDDINHIDHYRKARTAFETNLVELDALSATWNNTNIERLEILKGTFQKWIPGVRQLFELHNDPGQNQPALRIANDEIPKLRTTILAKVDQLGVSQKQLSTVPTNAALSSLIVDFRISFEALIANIQAYATSGEVTARTRYGAALTAAGAAWRKLLSFQLYPHATYRSQMPTIGQNVELLFQASNRIVSIMEGEHAREDLYLFWTEVSPRTDQMLNLLDKLTLDQQQLLNNELDSAKRSLLKTQIQTILGSGLALIIGIIMALVFRKIITKPVVRLTATSEKISQGDLEIQAVVESTDEIGRLAVTFNKMTTRLRRMIADLRESAQQLKQVAETNASLYKQKQMALNEMETLYTISRRMITAENLSALIAAVVEEISIPAINRAVLMAFEYSFDEEIETVEVKANWHSGKGRAPTAVGTRYDIVKIPMIHYFVGGTPKFFDDLFEDERADPAALAVARALNIRAMAALPLWNHGRQIGTLLLEGEHPYAFSESEIRPYLSMLGQLAAAVENQHLMEETRERAAELAVAKEKAESANRAKTLFLANMGHELRTPLNVILGFAQLMDREAGLNDRQQEYAKTINNSATHLLSLINDVLEISKIEAGRIELTPATFNLHAFVDNMESMFRMQMQVKGLELFVIHGENLPAAVVCDESKLRQIVINLLGNALKFTEKGVVELRVTTEPASGGMRLIIEIEDTGLGIAEKEIETVFRPFEQILAGVQNNVGTGLGLAISRTYARLMGGDIRVNSQLGQGSLFRLDVGIEVGLAARITGKSKLRQIIGLEKDQEQPRILIVDDIADNRLLLTKILGFVGFRVREACNGKEGVQAFEQWSPHLILMDLRMPVMDGIEASRRIRDLGNGRNTPIVVVSAAVNEADKREAMAVCDDFVVKPIREDQLFETIGKHLKLRYVYKGITSSAPQPSGPPLTGESIISQRLTSVPPELCKEMYNALILLMVQDIERSIEKVMEYDPDLHTAMKTLADSFAYGRLIDLLDPYVKESIEKKK